MRIKQSVIPLAAAILTAALVASVGARAQHMGGMEGGWHHDGMDMLHGVSLTDAQRDQVRQIAKSTEAQSEAVMTQLKTLHDKIADGVLSGATMEQIAPVMHQEEALRDQMDTQRLATALQMRDILTPAQREAAAATHAKLAALHEQEHAVMAAPTAQ